MTKAKRIRWEMGVAVRATTAASTARHDKFQAIRDRYDMSTAGAGGTHSRAIFVGPGKHTS